MTDITFVQGDNRPSIKGTISQTVDGVASVRNLSDVTEIKFQMRRSNDRRYTVDAVASILDAATGRVEYVWGPNDLDVPAEYQCQWQLTFGDGGVETTQPPNTITVRRQ